MSEKKIQKREEMNDIYKWNMCDVYKDEEAWKKDIQTVTELYPELQKMQGIICESIENFSNTLMLMTKIEFLVEKIYFYANQKYNENLGNSKYQALANEAYDLLTKFYSISSFVEPELLSADENKIWDYLKYSEDLNQYEHYFADLFRQKEHILNSDQEEILAKTQNFSQTSSEVFSVFNNADLKFPIIKDEHDNEVQLTHSRLSLYLESKNRRVREDTFKGLYKTYSDFKNTLSAIYLGSLKKDSFYADVRKYQSSRQMYLSDSNIPENVYDNLITTVNDNLSLLHRYIRIRKRVMGVDELHLYDVYTPLVEDYNKDISYEEAKDMVIEGLAPMGEEYLNLLKEGFNNRWIDVYENEGKKSGAYSWSIYGTHPYVLLNYQPNLNNVCTIAHEMGHALHSYYSNQNQKYSNSEYKIFVAEVASTCNESLLMNYLIDKATNQKEKAYLINHFLEQFRGTLFRQTMFAEFEDTVHKEVDAGNALNCERLCQIYYDLNKKYFGDDIVVDQEIEMEWARIPHFYSAFYVYQYATGFSAAISLSQKILDQGEEAVQQYKKFLKGGCSLYPIELLKLAGVDMSTAEPVQQALKVFEKLLDEFERLIGK